MSAPSPRSLSWEEYEHLPEDIRNEYIDGRLVVTPFLTGRHAHVILELQVALRAVLPRYWIVDTRDRVLLALVLVDGSYEITARLDDDNPVADLDTGAGTVRISLPDLLS